MLKKLIPIVVSLIIAFQASAELRWGASADVSFNNFHWKEKLLQTNMRTGGNLGITGEVMIPGIGFGVDFGLRYALQGAKVNFGEWPVWSSDGFGDQTVWVHSVQIPLHLRFKYTRLEGLEETIAPLAYVGPVASFQVSNNCKALDNPAGTMYLDFGLGCELFERVQISGGYLWGLSYLVRTQKLENLSARADGFHINLSYFF